MKLGFWAKPGGILASLATLFLFSGLAGAQTPVDAQSAAATAEANVVTLEAQSQAQEAQLGQRVEGISAVGGNVQETQALADGAVARSQELSQRNQALQGELDVQQQEFEQSKALYKEQVQAAYKGDNLEGVVAVLDSVFSSNDRSSAVARSQTQRALVQSRQRLEDFRKNRVELQNTIRLVSQKNSEYKESLVKKRARARELQRKEARLEAQIFRLRDDKAQTDGRIQKLRKAERRRILNTKPANGGPSAQRRSELRIAKNNIVARPVDPISKKRYRKLYRKSAKKYGFGRDWYILAAVGKVETNHGQNMGPSSAGAMGPMQFMPSTWESSGVDGNGDGVANVMDPRDAIPAAAKYLQTGGAPEDWYAALYSYNHADWYVKKVLGVAEGYRRLAKDNRVGPYV